MRLREWFLLISPFDLASDGVERWNHETHKKQDQMFQGTVMHSLALADNQVWV